MNLTTISDLTRTYGISTRTLRYYEQMGLIQSVRQEDYAYRAYDEKACRRVGQIVLLRKLRLPVKKIAELLHSDDAMHAVAAFEERLREIAGEVDALMTLRDILTELIQRLQTVSSARLSDRLLSDERMAALIDSIKDEAPKLKEARSMNDLNQADSILSKLRDVRILYLPPATVVAAHFIGPDPEDMASDMIEAFARANDLIRIKPDLRMYGFNHPNPVDETNSHGYEFWLTIPDDLDVPAPLQKKRFPGGLYAAHMIRMGDFQEWAWLDQWVRENGEYVYAGKGDPENMFDSLEEHLNIFSHLSMPGKITPTQLDLLIPVRKK